MKKTVISLLAIAITWLICTGGCDERKDNKFFGNFSSRSYKGHATDLDSNNFVTAYPSARGTRLDDCQTCHKAGDIYRPNKSGTPTWYTYNPCLYCHLIIHPDNSIINGAPTGYADTLNVYGVDYRNSGRNVFALFHIQNWDSDNDAYTSKEEIKALCYPGDPSSNPGQPVIPVMTLKWSDITSMTEHNQFLLLNSHKQEFDTYALYKGVKIKDLLAEVGVDLACATSITVIAPDGYQIDYTLDEVNNQFPNGLWFSGLERGGVTLPGTDQGFVYYSPEEFWPSGISYGLELPDEMWLMLAYRRDGVNLSISYLDPVSGRIDGEGPYRSIIPQSVPGSPDRGSKYSPTAWGDGWDYDDTKDHNAGSCVRGVVAIRVNPLLAGFEEFDWKNGGFSLCGERKLILYGTGVPEK